MDGATYEGRQHGSGGVSYCVNHNPLEKFRLLFLLKKPFSFSEGGTQEERIKEWKELIKTVSDRLDVPYDRSCVDPSRLMYTPRIPMAADVNKIDYEIVLYGGGYLDHENLDESLPYLFGNAPTEIESDTSEKKVAEGQRPTIGRSSQRT